MKALTPFIRHRVVAVAAILAACLTPVAGQPPKTDKEPKMSERKRQVVDLLESIETGDQNQRPSSTEEVRPTQPRRGRRHRRVRRGPQQLPKGSAKVKTVRVFEDGEFVFAHTEYDFFGPKIGFDVFRFEDGKIVEHWDNLQETPKKPNPSGHTMTDGPTEVKDADKTAASKKLVRDFVDDVLVGGKMDRLAGYFDGTTTSSTTHRSLTACRGWAGAGGDGEGGCHDEVREGPQGARRGELRAGDERRQVRRRARRVLRPVPGGEGQDRRALGHDRAIPEKKDWKNQNGKF